MENNKLVLLVIVYFATICYCMPQSKITWSKLNDGGQSDVQFLIGNSNNSIYLLNRNSGFFLQRDKWYIDVYNDSTVQKLTTSPFVFSNNNEHFEQPLNFDTVNYILTETYADEVKQLLVYQIGRNGNQVGLPKSITKIDACRNRNDYNFHVYTNPLINTISIAHFTNVTVKDSVQVKCMVVSDDLSVNYSKTVQLPFKTIECVIENGYYANSKLLLLFKVSDAEAHHFFSNATYSYYMFQYNFKTDETIVDKLNIEKESTLVGSSFFIDSANSAGVCGFIRSNSKGFTNSNWVNLFIQKFEKKATSEAKIADDYAMPNEAQNLYHDEFPYLYTPLLCEAKYNGDVHLLTEKSTTETSCLTDFRTGMQRCNYYYHNDGIEKTVFSKTNTVKKDFVIDKKQITINDYGIYLGATAARVGTEIHLFYNDTKQNYKGLTEQKTKPSRSKKQYMNSPRKSVVIHATISDDGTIKKDILFSNEGAKTIFMPHKSYIDTKGKMIFYCKRFSRYRIGVMDLMKE